MKIVSIITARGGSTEIPLKNIIDVNGEPLISYSINASLNSNVDETWVSTDSTKISNVSKDLGAKVLIRPDEISTGTSQSEEALLHFAENVDFDILVFIQPTSPFISSKYINIGINQMQTHDSVFTVTKEHWLPRWDRDVNPINWDIRNRPMRQQKPEVFVEAGMFYITKRKNLVSSKLRYSGNIGFVEIPLEDSFQIDTYDDLKLVEKILSNE